MRARWAAAILPLAWLAPGPAAEELPGIWFQSVLDVGDSIVFSVGGTGEAPPRSSREVLLGWSWDEAMPGVDRYPGPVAARYRPSWRADRPARPWRADGTSSGAPRIAVGPGRELLFLGDDEPSTARAMRWAELLDAVEAAYRHSAPDLRDRERRGALEVGRVGRCRVRSVPVDGAADGWSGLRLDRPDRPGGVEVQRFQRFVDGAGDCSGRGLDLALFPTPREEALDPPFFVVWPDRELPRVGFLDLEPAPRTAAVRALARPPGTASEEINVAGWPRATARGVDLCRAPFMDTLCLKDLRIREQLATAATADPAAAGPLIDGCREFFDSLPSVPSPHPCTDPRAWRRTVGTYRTGYTGEMVLRDRPRLVSRMDAAGAVQWLLPDARSPGGATRFPLADGTRVGIVLPRAAPAAIAEQPPPARPATPRPAAVTAPTTAPAPTRDAPAPRLTGTAVDSGRLPGPAASEPDPPAAVEVDPPRTAVATARPEPQASDPPPVDTAPRKAEPQEPAAVRNALAAAPTPRRLLWPLVVAALAMTVLVALLLRGQRTSARARRHAPATGALAAELEPDASADLPLASSPADDPAPEEAQEPPEEAEAPPAAVLPLEPPELTDPLPMPTGGPWRRLARERAALAAGERRGIDRSLTAITRLGEWVCCLLPVLDEIEHGQGELPALDRLPEPARAEWRESRGVLREFAGLDAVVCHRLRRELDGRPSALDDEGAETPYLAEAGLLDPERGALPERLRRHLLRPGDGRIQPLVLALQYLIEAFPVEHLDPRERRAYLSAVRRRLEEKELSTKFHQLVDELASGLGLRYRQVRFYKSRVEAADARDALDLSGRVGYPAATDADVVVRLSELFLSDPESRESYSGRALVADT